MKTSVMLESCEEVVDLVTSDSVVGVELVIRDLDVAPEINVADDDDDVSWSVDHRVRAVDVITALINAHLADVGGVVKFMSKDQVS